MTYVDPVVERREWQKVRVAVEGGWLRAVRARLQRGPAMTCELAAEAKVESGRPYQRFMYALRRSPGIRCVGKRTGPSKHANKVWELAT